MAKRKGFDFYGDPPVELERFPFYGFELDDDQLEFANAIWSPDYDIVFARGAAGTGKTQVAVGVANMLVQYGMYDGILGVVSPCEESRQGYLPGDITQKSAVYFEPFYQAMIECGMNPELVISDETLANDKNGTAYVKLITHTYTRGSTFKNRVVILDEFQNFSLWDAKKVLTRCDDSTKVIVCGHDGQCDLERPDMSGFLPYLRHFAPEKRCKVCTLTTNHRGWVSSHADALDWNSSL